MSRSIYRLPLTMTVGIASLTVPNIAQAAVPPAIVSIIAKVDTAATGRQLPELLRHYSPNFTTTDGLTKATWQQSISQFWQNYPSVKYTTTIESWKPDGNGYSVDTITKITGKQTTDGRTLNLSSTIKSRQKIAGGQILQQQVLQERTEVISGTQPPTVEFNLPDKLQTNTEYSLDAIVKEPLGEDVLMGAAIEQPVSPQGYLQPSTDYKLELLNAGGLFKTARAPGKSGDYWLSTVFIRPSGMATYTQRVRVVRGN
jgi:hypothetical protein